MSADLFGRAAVIPVLSLWQPWASLIFAGAKLHETRHWPTRVRGLVGIHAAKRLEVDDAPGHVCDVFLGPKWRERGALPGGAMLGVVDLTGCHRAEDIFERITPLDYDCGYYAAGRFGLRMENARPLAEPIPLIGRQGFFSWPAPDDLDARLLPPVDHLAAYDRWVARP